MTLLAKVVADSVSPDGVRITTMQLRYWRFIHSEFMTHRVFSRNASSSRAIPVEKIIAEVRDNPAMPIHWGKNQRGMQAAEELDTDAVATAQWYWHNLRNEACYVAERLSKLGTHKQVVNRILEPFMWINVIVTATEWDNFYALRRHPDAQPEMQALANAMWESQWSSTPRELKDGEWHLPYVNNNDRADVACMIDDFDGYQLEGKDLQTYKDTLCKISAARCARVSYKNHDGTECNIDNDLHLAKRLIESKHMSPFEHQARPAEVVCGYAGWGDEIADGLIPPSNFKGWVQYRKLIERGV